MCYFRPPAPDRMIMISRSAPFSSREGRGTRSPSRQERQGGTRVLGRSDRLNPAVARYQSRLQASDVVHRHRSGRSRPSFGEDWVADAARADRRDRREPRCIAGRRVPTGRRLRMLPRQSALMPLPCMRAARTPRRTSREPEMHARLVANLDHTPQRLVESSLHSANYRILGLVGEIGRVEIAEVVILDPVVE
jgi:hypothetical protein